MFYKRYVSFMPKYHLVVKGEFHVCRKNMVTLSKAVAGPCFGHVTKQSLHHLKVLTSGGRRIVDHSSQYIPVTFLPKPYRLLLFVITGDATHVGGL